MLHNLLSTDYWTSIKLICFELYLNFSRRLKTLEEQKDSYWSSRGRPPDHYARTMALRLARIYVKEFGQFPTIGTSSDGDHPSTHYGRLLEELFGILEIQTNFRLPG